VAIPTLSVQLSLDASSYGNTYFVLDNATRGVLDNTTYTLGGEYYVDITSYAQTITVNRGRSRELDRYATGQASLSFQNQDRTFDPSYSSSTLYPNVVPRRPVRVTANGYSIYQGYVDDWNLDYNVSGESDATATCVDGFGILSKQTLAAATATAQTTGARIAAVLAKPEVNWPLSLEAIDVGVQTLQADVINQDTNALTYLQLVESSEPGSFFMSKDGKATFKDRNTAAVVGSTTLSDDGTGIPYNEVQVVYGTELLYNRVVITRAGGSPQTANNTTSQTTYGLASLDQSGLLTDTDANALSLANYLVGQYSSPELRFDSVTIELSALSTANQNTLLGLELTNVIVVKFQPNRTGARISQNCQIIGIAHQVRPDSHRLTLKLAQTDGRVAFVLDDAVFGVLDTSELGF
jgi:hypothetical protein